MAKSETHSFHAPRSHGFVRVAAATPVVHVADPAANAEEHERLIRQAGEAGADLLVFPELSLSAYAIDDPHAADLTALHQRTLGQGASAAAVQAMLSYAPEFGDLAGNEPLADALLPALQSLQTRGVRATLEAVNRGELGA